MEYFSVVKDSDIFNSVDLNESEYKPRLTSKGIVLDEKGNIAILSNGEHSLFPGGGVEDGETYEQAFVRECKEEIGCDVEVSASLGRALQFRLKNKMKYEIEFFIAKVVGDKGAPTTNEAGELACILSWLSKEEILTVLEMQISHIRHDDYPAHFNCHTHLDLFKRFLKNTN